MSEEVQEVDTVSNVPGVKKSTNMVWTEEHDLLLCREIIAAEVFSSKRGTLQRSAKWNQVASQLCGIPRPHFKVEKRSVRDRYNLLSDRLRLKLKREAKESGISPEMTETEQALEFIIEHEDSTEQAHKETSEKAKQKDRKEAEDVRKKAMEKLGTTQKRKSGEEGRQKKRRSNGSDTITFLKEKNEQHMNLAREKLQIKAKQFEAETKRHDDLIKFMQHQHQMQLQNLQAIMTQQQQQMQQHAQLVMKVLDKLGR